MRARRHGVGILLVAALTAAGFALTVAAFYPGYMTNDAGYVYGFAKAGRYGDWQSPLMSLLWRLIDPIAPGPGSMFLLVAALYWLGFGIVGLTLARRTLALGAAVPVLGLVPPAFMLLAMIWRDVLFGATWLVAAALAFAAAGQTARARMLPQALAVTLIGFGVLLRPTAMFAAPLLTAYVIWPTRIEWKRSAILFLPAVVAGFALIQVVYYGVLDVKREHPLHSLLVFDLGGITHFSGVNQFPVPWTAEQTALLTAKCYDPDRWDTYWTMEPCSFVMRRLERPDDAIFGTARLVESWRQAVVSQPLAYLRHRAAYMWKLLAGSNLTLELYHANDPARTPLARSRAFQAVLALHERLKSTLLFRTGFWLLIAGAICALAWRRRETPPGAFAVGVTASAVAYVATFLPFGVAAEFRYGYWAVLAGLAGGAATLAATGARTTAAIESSG
jgi:hypothetical protein